MVDAIDILQHRPETWDVVDITTHEVNGRIKQRAGRSVLRSPGLPGRGMEGIQGILRHLSDLSLERLRNCSELATILSAETDKDR